MVFKLYGLPLSSAALRVAVVLHEKQVPFELVLVDFASGEHKSAEYLKKQPFGQVPYIDDNGLILYESRAISRYLCDKYATQGAQLIPNGTVALAIFEQMVSVETANFDVGAAQALTQKFFNPIFKIATDEEAYVQGLKKLNDTLAVYETILSKQKYLAGSEVTLADLFHLPCLHLADKTGILSLDGKPSVARWYKEISSRPSWEAVKETMIRDNVEKFSV